ncbi:MAG: sigma-70 family RNA polymerase sigma factor [Acidobacteriia bacterium]|nr:sigma-70 family RNA polymerase sigma factor [Terriglobia bacterium]
MTREQILTTLRERILAYATSRIGRDPAEDLTQETLLVIEEKYSHLDAVADLVPLSFQILRFKIADYQRRGVRRGEFRTVSPDGLDLADGSEDAQTLLERKELEERLHKAMGKLEGRCRELFRLKLEGMSFREIQTELGAESINTVYTWDLRCRKRLLDLMGGSWESRR